MTTVYLILIGIPVGLYVLSLMLHPYVPCERCEARGGTREYGRVFSSAYRPCWRCRGRGTKQRLGARVLGIGEPRYSRKNGRFAPPTSDFPKPGRTRIFGIF
jgi:hypothetical protein